MKIKIQTSKWLTTALMTSVLAAAVLGVAGCGNQEQQQNGGQPVKYTCSMHPEVVQDKPGNCPKCGMKLVEKR